MFELSTRARIGLYVMVELARDAGRLRSTVELADTLDVSVNHLAKVMGALAKEGFVDGTRGPAGGYLLMADPKKISMADVIAVFEGRPKLGSQCSLKPGKTCKHAGRCEIKNVVREIEEHAYYTFDSVTIHLLAHPRKGSTTRPAPLAKTARGRG